MARTLSSLGAEVDEARLVGVEGESIPSRRLPRTDSTRLASIDVLERHHRVVGEPDKDALPSSDAVSPPSRTIRPAHSAGRCSRGRARSHPLAGSPGRAAQETVFNSSCLQPFVNHPSDNAVRHSLVKERSELGVRNRVEILAYVDIQHPVKTLGPQHVLQSAERLVSRPSRPEAVRAGQEVLFVDRFQAPSTARCATLSSKVGMPSGRCEPSALGMYARRTGGA